MRIEGFLPAYELGCKHELGELPHITCRSPAEIFKDITYSSNVPLSRKQDLIAYFLGQHPDRCSQETDNEQDDGHTAPCPPQQQEDRVFHCFPQLPPELRSLIFQHAVEPRILPMSVMKRPRGRGEDWPIRRRRMPVVASVSREARHAVKLLGHPDLWIGLQSDVDWILEWKSWYNAKTSDWASNCGFMMAGDIVHFFSPFEDPEAALSEPIRDGTASLVYHPRAIPRILGTQTMAMSLDISGSRMYRLPGLYGEVVSRMKEWRFLKDVEALKTLHVVLMGRSVCYNVAAHLRPDLQLCTAEWRDQLCTFVDIYDDQHWAEIMSLDDPSPGYEDYNPVVGTESCMHCVRKKWESEIKSAVETGWVLFFEGELESYVEILDEDYKLIRDNPWVKTKLDMMPELQPCVKFTVVAAGRGQSVGRTSEWR